MMNDVVGGGGMEEMRCSGARGYWGWQPWDVAGPRHQGTKALFEPSKGLVGCQAARMKGPADQQINCPGLVSPGWRTRPRLGTLLSCNSCNEKGRVSTRWHPR